MTDTSFFLIVIGFQIRGRASAAAAAKNKKGSRDSKVRRTPHNVTFFLGKICGGKSIVARQADTLRTQIISFESCVCEDDR